jgi:16S rRNA (uracil1498-N3)-methyltransferase
MDMIIQKAVELGAAGVIPVAMKRCVVKLDSKKAEKKTRRWNEIAKGAASQAKRSHVPLVYPVMDFKEAVDFAKNLDILLLPYEDAEGMAHSKKVIESVKDTRSAGIFIGPEGGFEEREVLLAEEAGAQTITLGHRILRTETAGMAVLSILMFLLETDN